MQHKGATLARSALTEKCELLITNDAIVTAGLIPQRSLNRERPKRDLLIHLGPNENTQWAELWEVSAKNVTQGYGELCFVKVQVKL